jgi:hypothetical protein
LVSSPEFHVQDTIHTGIIVENGRQISREITSIPDVLIAYHGNPISSSAVIGFEMKKFIKYSDVPETLSGYHAYAQRSNFPFMQVFVCDSIDSVF